MRLTICDLGHDAICYLGNDGCPLCASQTKVHRLQDEVRTLNRVAQDLRRRLDDDLAPSYEEWK